MGAIIAQGGELGGTEGKQGKKGGQGKPAELT
jgi:hypothetical protein